MARSGKSLYFVQRKLFREEVGVNSWNGKARMEVLRETKHHYDSIGVRAGEFEECLAGSQNGDQQPWSIKKQFDLLKTIAMIDK